MTVFNAGTAAALNTFGYDALSWSVGVALTLLLALLLFLRELAPRLGWGVGETGRAIRTVDIVLVPLLLVFAIVIGARLSELVR